MATERELSEEALKAIVDGVTAKLRETLPELTASTAGRMSGGELGASDETPSFVRFVTVMHSEMVSG